MARNLRGLYIQFEHDRPADWDFLRRWQPSVVRLKVNGSHTDPGSISIDKIQRLHDQTGARILIRCWDVDDRRGDGNPGVYGDLQADPHRCAATYHDYWRRFMDRLPGNLRDNVWAGAINETHPDLFPQTFDFTDKLLDLGTRDGVPYGVFMFSVGTPPLPSEKQPYGWQKFALFDDRIADGGHVAVCHEYMQPEGMYAVWTDDTGQERRDYGYLIGRHLFSGLKRAPLIIGEWGIEGLIYNRHPDPAHGGHSGWLNFRELWGPERYADEYVECIRQAAPNVISIDPFASDIPDKKHTWNSFDIMPAYGALLARKELCVRDDVPPNGSNTIHLPIVTAPGPDTPTSLPPETQPPLYPAGIIDPRALAAILQIESGGAGFVDKRLKIRFEAHIFRSELHDDTRWGEHFRVGDPAWTGQQWRMGPSDMWRMLHTGQQDDEWAAFRQALAIDTEAACRSISMGAAQIMGFNHARIGYPTATAMFEAMQESEAVQLFGLINFILSAPALADAIRRRDWRTVAGLYNGDGQVELYSSRLAAAYDAA